MASQKCQHQNLPLSHPEKSPPNRRRSLPVPLDRCVDTENKFDTQEFLAEIRSLSPSELERLIRSYAR